MNFQVFHVNPGEKLKKKMLITILAILCQSFLINTTFKNFRSQTTCKIDRVVFKVYYRQSTVSQSTNLTRAKIENR